MAWQRRICLPAVDSGLSAGYTIHLCMYKNYCIADQVTIVTSMNKMFGNPHFCQQLNFTYVQLFSSRFLLRARRVRESHDIQSARWCNGHVTRVDVLQPLRCAILFLPFA